MLPIQEQHIRFILVADESFRVSTSNVSHYGSTSYMEFNASASSGVAQIGLVDGYNLILVAPASANMYYKSNNHIFQNQDGSTNLTKLLSTGVWQWQNNVWHQTLDGKNEFYFVSNGKTYFGSQGGYQFRNAADAGIAYLSDSGALCLNTPYDFAGSAPLHIVNSYANYGIRVQNGLSGDFMDIFDDGNPHIEARSGTTLWINGNSANPVSICNGGGLLSLGNASAGWVNVNGGITTYGQLNINGLAVQATGFQCQDITSAGIASRINSGWFQTSNATTALGFPITTNSWYHLHATTHSNQSNYYSMQLAADFFNQRLFYRSTANSGSRAWNEISHSTNGAMILLGTITVSAAAELRSNTILTSGYKRYIIMIDNITVSVNAASLSMRWYSGADLTSNYYGYGFVFNSGGSSSSYPSDKIDMTITGRVSNAAGIGVSGEITMFQPTGLNCRWKGSMIIPDYSVGSRAAVVEFRGQYNGTTVPTGFVIYPSSGTITGTVSVYGMN